MLNHMGESKYNFTKNFTRLEMFGLIRKLHKEEKLRV
jgi:hypothetical protein